MNEENPDEPHLAEEEHTHIRALLAELGSGPDGRPMPPEVADRLDDTLARLVAERTSTADDEEDASASGNVVPLRRRWASRATAAAAAVIVVGAGGVAAANLGIFDNGQSISSDSGAAAGDSQVAESAPDATPTSPATSPGTSLLEKDGTASRSTVAALPRIRAGSFASDVRALLAASSASATAEGSTADEREADPDSGADSGADNTGQAPDLLVPGEPKQGPSNVPRFRSCPGPAITDGAVPNPIRYDELLAVLVIHPKSDGQQLVEAWSCAGDRKLAATTITPASGP